MVYSRSIKISKRVGVINRKGRNVAPQRMSPKEGPHMKKARAVLVENTSTIKKSQAMIAVKRGEELSEPNSTGLTSGGGRADAMTCLMGMIVLDFLPDRMEKKP